MRARVAFVTGGAGGLGACASRHLAKRGWTVFAADVDEAALAHIAREPRITAVPLDVTDPASVERARARLAADFDGLDGVVNFAGILALGSVVEMDGETMRRVLDVNVLGTARVNRALFPLVLARKGRIVNISSETGWQSAMPFNGAYAMSKHAVEAYSDALRQELAFLGVAVIKVQPGPFRTPMVSGLEAKLTRVADESIHFGDLLHRIKHLTLKEEAKANDPAVLAEVVHTALTSRRPRAAYSVRPDAARSALSALPPWAADRLVRLGLRILA